MLNADILLFLFSRCRMNEAFLLSHNKITMIVLSKESYTPIFLQIYGKNVYNSYSILENNSVVLWVHVVTYYSYNKVLIKIRF